MRPSRWNEENETGRHEDRANALIEVLARHGYPNDNELCWALTDKQIEGSWLEIFLIDLVGHCRVKAAIPVLMDKFMVDGEISLERVSLALGRIQDPEIPLLIKARYFNEPEHFRIYAGGCLERFYHPNAGSALLELAPKEELEWLRTSMLSGLCGIFDHQGLELVLDVARRGDYDRHIADLRFSVLSCAAVLGVDFPERQEWEQAREEKYQRIDAATRGVLPFRRQPVSLPAETLRHSYAKVGRNDPCPCSSGKKYKKCCLKEATAKAEAQGIPE